MFTNEPNVAAPFDILYTPAPQQQPAPTWAGTASPFGAGQRATTGALQVRVIDRALHTSFSAAHSSSFTQSPDWAEVKRDWRSQGLGWFDLHDNLVGTALVLYRPVPKLPHSLAYAPEGPILPWIDVSADPGRWLDPFIAHLRKEQAFAVRIGPDQLIRTWSAATGKRGLADPEVLSFNQMPPDEVYRDGITLDRTLTQRGWVPIDRGPGFGSGQPRFGVRIHLGGRTKAELLADTNQQWRRNVARSVKSGVQVREAGLEDIPAFHKLYRETGERDAFRPRPESYFVGMWKALATGPEPKLRMYIAEYGPERTPLACAQVIQNGLNCWYSYGASSGENRQVQASTAVQWHAIMAAHDRGAASYDLRGITDTLDPSDQKAGLVRFKLGTGGTCWESVGEYELILSPLIYKAFQAYRKLRS